MTSPEADAYVLGTDDEELERLRHQHDTWARAAHALWNRAGLRAGHTILDLGCGPGYTSLDLADRVGPEGKVIARDMSRRFLGFLQTECERLSVAQVETSLGPAETMDLAPGQLDGAYARWLLCWLPDPLPAVERVVYALKPGGFIALQDYIDWGALKTVPPSKAVQRAVEACMASWAGVGINIGDDIPAIAGRFGLTIEYFAPVAHLAPVGSGHWQWLAEFFQSYLPKLVERGLLADAELREFNAEWEQYTDEGTGYCFTPVMADVILRKQTG
jgi:SAM-dependent methyltransferase